MREINLSKSLELQLVVTGSHLSKRHGYTVNEIKNDGFVINSCLDIELDEDRNNNVCSSISRCIKLFSDTLEIPHPRMTQRQFVLVPLRDVLTTGWPSYFPDINQLCESFEDSVEVIETEIEL